MEDKLIMPRFSSKSSDSNKSGQISVGILRAVVFRRYCWNLAYRGLLHIFK